MLKAPATYKPTCYLAGPMSGYENYNFAEFNHVATILRGRGWNVINPAETAGGASDMGRPWYFKYDFGVILNCCDGMFLLPDWDKSQGATAEVVVAHELGLPIVELDRDYLEGKAVTVEKVSVDVRRT